MLLKLPGIDLNVKDCEEMVPFQYCVEVLLIKLLQHLPPSSLENLVRSHPWTFISLALDVLKGNKYTDGIQLLHDHARLFEICAESINTEHRRVSNLPIIRWY